MPNWKPVAAALVAIILLGIGWLQFRRAEENALAPGSYELQGGFHPAASGQAGPRRFEAVRPGSLRSSPFTLPRGGRLSLMVSGNPNEHGNHLELERLDSGQILPLAVDEPPRPVWRMFTWQVPAEWRGAPVRLAASLASSGFDHDLGVSEPFEVRAFAVSPGGLAMGLRQFLYLFWVFLFLAAPGAAAILAAMRLGLVSPARLFAVAVCAVAAIGYASLWLYLLAVPAGRVFSCAVLGASAVYIAYTWRQAPEYIRQAMADLRYPVVLWVFATVLYLALGFLYGGFERPLLAASMRYFHWAADNELPFVYAAKILDLRLAIHWTNWNVYARPPLMTGLVLFIFPAGLGMGTYQVAGVALQTLVLPTAWCFLTAMGVYGRRLRVVLSMCVFSVFMLVNAFFVWPKLLAAAFLFLAAGFLLGQSKHAADPYLAGAALGFAALSHGGSVFGAAAIFVVLAVGSARSWTRLGRTVLMAALLLLPWTVYAGRSGRPTNELINWHLGGTLPGGVAKGESSWQVIRRGYATLSGEEILANKMANFRFQFVPGASFDGRPKGALAAGFPAPADWIFRCLVFVVAAPLTVLLLWARGALSRRPFDRAAAVTGALGLAGTTLWCLLMFGPKMAFTDASNGNAAAILPQGSLWVPLCALIALALLVEGLGALPARLMLLLQVILFAVTAAHPQYVEGPATALKNISVPNSFMAFCALLSASVLLAGARDKQNS